MNVEVFSKIAKVIKDNKIGLHYAFRAFDKNQDGTIDINDFKTVFTQMKLDYNVEEFEAFIASICEDGRVNYQKFIQLLENNNI